MYFKNLNIEKVAYVPWYNIFAANDDFGCGFLERVVLTKHVLETTIDLMGLKPKLSQLRVVVLCYKVIHSLTQLFLNT